MTDHVTGDGEGWPSLISALNPSEEAYLVGRLGGRDILLPENEHRQYPLRGHLWQAGPQARGCLLYTSPSPRDRQKSRMPSSA